MDKKELMRIIGDNLQEVRMQRGFTQEKMAEKVGISTSFYANIERGIKGVSVYVLNQIAAELDVSVDYLLNSNHSTVQMSNINLLLRDAPESFILYIEEMIRLSKTAYEKMREDG